MHESRSLTSFDGGAFAARPIPTYPDLAGKVAVVTGGARGIGAATCRLLGANGARVVVNGRDRAAIAEVADAIRCDGAEVLGIAADVTDVAAIEGMRDRTERDLGPVDILVAFAGGSTVHPGPVHQITEAEWRAVVDGNLTAAFLTAKAFLPAMIHRRRGAIVTMASTAARLPLGAPAPYAAAKAGVATLSRCLAAEVGRHGIRVNCIAPSAIRTERTARAMPEEVQRQVAALHPLGRLGEPDDVALATLYLVSDSAAWLTGVTLDVAGGRIMV
ncbi:MAG TPA: SDR family NAD(P)-dependent oxidoreductase [bacterium]|nr:SDR family NAD(P)-dependent oxidoreductase [bacterium]